MLIWILAAVAADPCDKSTTLAMIECASKGFEEAELALNTQWQATVAEVRKHPEEQPEGFGPGYLEILRQSQRAWVAYRDAQCELEGEDAHGGTIRPAYVLLCKIGMDEERTQALRELPKEYLAGEN